MGPGRIQFQVVNSDAIVGRSGYERVNYLDPNYNVRMPVFSIHGNHDDPSAQGGGREVRCQVPVCCYWIKLKVERVALVFVSEYCCYGHPELRQLGELLRQSRHRSLRGRFFALRPARSLTQCLTCRLARLLCVPS